MVYFDIPLLIDRKIWRGEILVSQVSQFTPIAMNKSTRDNWGRNMNRSNTFQY